MAPQRCIDEDTEVAVRRFLTRIASRYDVVGALLYGSRARGDHQPDSDADLALLLRGRHQRLLTTAIALGDVAYDILLETGINISPLPVWLDDWEQPQNAHNPALLNAIARDGIPL
ncbi:nucleotidyltransferase domain-containing protein [Zavarzinia aquatilis]|uniref:DNA polymerase III subunit beta n=1 Tax=Zavarzinia aquatilis TaxID=2211142 RepID=A0A317DUY2_9PROT|nr:nucleotidyltransferase domain-containing protein [Zavarzinia aquatilis]PWR18488.1 DNA polymerase III subunit beta [Zavarzinia aquatilis]